MRWRQNLRISKWCRTAFKLRDLHLPVLSEEVVKATRKPIYYEVEDSSGDETPPRPVVGAAKHVDMHEYVHQCMAAGLDDSDPVESNGVSKIVIHIYHNLLILSMWTRLFRQSVTVLIEVFRWALSALTRVSRRMPHIFLISVKISAKKHVLIAMF